MKTQAKQMLEGVRDGRISVDEALRYFKTEPFIDMGFSKVDLHRKVRQGATEVIYGEGKTVEQIASILIALHEGDGGCAIATRVSKEKAQEVLSRLSMLNGDINASFEEEARIIVSGNIPKPDGMGTIVVAAGGTSDIPVAEEAAVTIEALGNDVKRVYDIGVAGVQRALAFMEEIMDATVIVAVAGMEGALPSLLGGLADCPVIAVPTSVGYGASFGGVAALLAMLNSCASGISVVNIDNGFGAGYMASMINHMEAR